MDGSTYPAYAGKPHKQGKHDDQEKGEPERAHIEAKPPHLHGHEHGEREDEGAGKSSSKPCQELPNSSVSSITSGLQLCPSSPDHGGTCFPQFKTLRSPASAGPCCCHREPEHLIRFLIPQLRDIAAAILPSADYQDSASCRTGFR